MTAKSPINIFNFMYNSLESEGVSSVGIFLVAQKRHRLPPNGVHL